MFRTRHQSLFFVVEIHDRIHRKSGRKHLENAVGESIEAFEILLLRFGEIAEDIVFGIHPFGPLDADAKPVEDVCGKMLDDRFEAVVAAGAALLAQADLEERDVHVVGDDEDVLRRDLEIVADGADGLAGEVHVGARLEQHESLALDDFAVEFGFLDEGQALRFRECVEAQESHVVLRPLIGLARVPETDDESHLNGASA